MCKDRIISVKELTKSPSVGTQEHPCSDKADLPLGGKHLECERWCDDGTYKSTPTICLCYLPLSQPRLWTEHSGLLQLFPKWSRRWKGTKNSPKPQICFLPAPEVINPTQNSRKQLSIEQDGEEQGGNCSLLKRSSSGAWGALEQHSSTYNFLPTQENNTADFQKITWAIAWAGYSACSFVGTTVETDCVS